MSLWRSSRVGLQPEAPARATIRVGCGRTGKGDGRTRDTRALRAAACQWQVAEHTVQDGSEAGRGRRQLGARSRAFHPSVRAEPRPPAARRTRQHDAGDVGGRQQEQKLVGRVGDACSDRQERGDRGKHCFSGGAEHGCARQELRGMQFLGALTDVAVRQASSPASHSHAPVVERCQVVTAATSNGLRGVPEGVHASVPFIHRHCTFPTEEASGLAGRAAGTVL